MYRSNNDDFCAAEDFTIGSNAASNAEPFSKPDHKAKRHGKPKHKRRFPRHQRNGELIGGGHFVFRRGDDTKRIRPCEWPFEHPDFESAMSEASRLAATYGGEFEVFARIASATSAPQSETQEAAYNG